MICRNCTNPLPSGSYPSFIYGSLIMIPVAKMEHFLEPYPSFNHTRHPLEFILCRPCAIRIRRYLHKIRDIQIEKSCAMNQPQLENVNNPESIEDDAEIAVRSDWSPHARLKMLVGAINCVRMTTTDPDLKLVMSNILRAGGVETDDRE